MMKDQIKFETEDTILKSIHDYAIKNGPDEEHGGRMKNYEIVSNYVDINYMTKIHVLDSIINHAKDVCGPFGGIYGEITGNEKVGEAVVRDGVYTKSKDGHSFFNTLMFGTRYAQTVMMGIQQLTKYIAGYEGETSRDGTTSVAVVGCSTARNLLGLRLEKPEIPSTIINIVTDIVAEEGSKLIDRDKVLIYNDGKYAEPYGKDFCINAIRTTVDNNNIFTDAFAKLMDEAENSFDITAAHLGTPDKRYGVPKLDLEIIPGIKFRAQAIDEKYAGGFRKTMRPVFILDGYISRDHINTFSFGFRTWIQKFLSIEDGSGYSAFDERSNTRITPPLFIVTRTPDYIQRMLEEFMEKGITITSSKGHTTNIKPLFMLGANVEGQEVHFNDMKDVFSELVVDLDAINQYILFKRTTAREGDEKNDGLFKQTTQTEVNILPLFPNFVTGEELRIEIPYSDIAFDKALKDKQEAVFDKIRTEIRKFNDLCLSVSYDGQSMYITPKSDAQKERAQIRRQEIKTLKDSYTDMSVESNVLDQRLMFFSGLTIKPTIYARGEDEYEQLFSIYEDALGVFQSVHVHGVMPGSNSYIMKVADEFRDNVVRSMRSFLSDNGIDENSERWFRYMDFAQDLVTSLIVAYENIIRILVNNEEESNRVLNRYYNMLSVSKEDILSTYNVVTGNWGDKILEATRTTADVFAGSIAIAKDMLTLKRIRIIPGTRENEIAKTSNREMPLHPIYNKFDKKEDVDK